MARSLRALAVMTVGPFGCEKWADLRAVGADFNGDEGPGVFGGKFLQVFVAYGVRAGLVVRGAA